MKKIRIAKILITLFVLALLAFVVVKVGPPLYMLYEDSQLIKKEIYYAEGLEQDDFDGLVDLMKFTYNSQQGEHKFDTSYDDIAKYSDAAFDEFLDLDINKNVNHRPLNASV